MNRPPYLMRVRVDRPGTNVNLWLPLFIILPLAAVILLALLPLWLVTVAVLWPLGWGRPLLAVVLAALDCICSVRGLEIEVEQGPEKILVSVK